MALDINAARMGAFRGVDLGNQDAIANLGENKGVEQNGKLGNFLGKMFRSSGTKEANNAIRTELLKSLGQAFGLQGMGEKNGKVTFSKAFMDKLEEALGPALKRSDFGINRDGTVTSGKPLTQRRINAIAAKVAQVAQGEAASRRLEVESGGTPLPPALEKTALAAGYSKAELPKLSSAANFYAEAKGVSVEEAFKEVSKSGTNANRLMNYGGRFLASQSNFTDGLRLIDSFKDWFAETGKQISAIKNDNYTDDMSQTVLNGWNTQFADKYERGMEKFVFEEIAHNPYIDITSDKPEEVFGMKNNAAMRFFGRHLNQSCTQTIAQIPVEKRVAFFAAMDKFYPPATDAKTAATPARNRTDSLVKSQHVTVAARILRHFDAIQQLHADGLLTTETALKTCFPDAKEPTIKGANDLFKEWDAQTESGDADLGTKPGKYADLSKMMSSRLEESGLSIDECAKLMRAGKPVPMPEYFAAGTLGLEGFDGGFKAAEDQLRGDLHRVDNYGMDGKALLPADGGFRLTFPGAEKPILTNGSAEGRKNIDAVVAKVKELCGASHTAQISGVMTQLSQSGLVNLRGGLDIYGISSNEHAAVDYNVSKDATTGAVTIKFSSPAELPFKFSWTATVDTNGNVSTTPMKFEKPLANISDADAKSAVTDAAQKMGVKLGKAETAAAASLYKQHAEGMYSKNADYLARFIAKLPLGDKQLAKTSAAVAAFAPELKGWSDVAEGDTSMRPLEKELAVNANKVITTGLAKQSNFTDNVFNTMRADANRGTFTFNGVTIEKSEELSGNELNAAVLAAFKKTVPDPKAQRVLSLFLNQAGFGDLMQCMNHVVPDNSAGRSNPLHPLGGAEKIANRDVMSGHNEMMLQNPRKGDGMCYALDVSPDGKTATVTLTLNTHLSVGTTKGGDFADATIVQRLTLDLSAATPTVTDIRLSQELQ